MAKTQHLNFAWSFEQGFEDSYLEGLPKEAEKVDLPHTPKYLPYHDFAETEYQGLFTYEKRFDDEYPALPEKTLHFDGAMLQMDVYFNGVNLGHFVSGYLPVDIDVSSLIQAKDNDLIVVLDSREDKLIPPFGNIVDYLSFAGLYRGVSLLSYPLQHIVSTFVQASASGHLEVKTELKHPIPELKVRHVLEDNGKVIAEFLGEVLDLSSPHLWSLDDPHLYTLRTFYGEDEKIDRVGFRDASFTPKGFFLNGQYTKIRGVNRHQTYPYFGAAAPASLQQDDADICKYGLGANLVRTSHYSDDESFLDRCDEIGLLLVDEIPGWQFISKEKKWRANLRDFCYRMIQKERNHPCLVAYGLRIDESPDDHELYSSLEEVKKQLDPKRPSLGVRNFKNSELLEDVYGYNDFRCRDLAVGLDDPKTYIKGSHPVLDTENMGHMFPTKSFDNEARLIEHALRHARVLDDSYSYPTLCGTIAWCAFDYNTHKDFGSGDHICYHGLSDIFRLPKPAAYLYASQGLKDVFYVASNLDLGEADQSMPHPIYVFTDADYVELYHGEDFVGKFLPDKEEYPHLPHPPVKIDDYFGESLKKIGFLEQDLPALKGLLSQFVSQGFDSLGLKEKLKFASICKKRKKDPFKTVNEISDLAFARGDKAKKWVFVGYKNGEEFARKVVSPSLSFHLEVTASKTSLKNDETYDAARVSIRKLDQNGTLMHFSTDPIQLRVSGPIEIMGPSLVSLVGGGTSVYVRSLSVEKPSKARLDIVWGEATQSVEFDVE